MNYFIVKRIGIVCLLFLVFLFFNVKASDLISGKITESVKCLNYSEESYAVYIPSNYSSKKEWPVIIAFDPAARGLIPVKLFRNSAEKFGYVVVCSNNSQNGPWHNIIKSMKAVWVDIQQKFSINTKRVYVTGFSGGSRAASVFSQVIKVEPVGIIACGAGLHDKLNPSRIKKSFYYGIIGLEDFNYKEFRRLVPKLEQAGVRYCIDYVTGGHKWPDEEVINRAVEWMEVDAVRRGLLDREKVPIEKIFLNSFKYAKSLYDDDQYYYYGLIYFESLFKHFNGILKGDSGNEGIMIKDIERKISWQKNHGKRFKKFIKKENSRYKREYRFIALFRDVFNRLEMKGNRRYVLNSILNDLKIPYLRRIMKKKKGSLDGYWAKRLLAEIAIKADKKSLEYFNRKDEKTAVLFRKIALRTGLKKNLNNFRLASIYAAFGKKKKCIKIIGSLLKEVKNLMDFVVKDPNFDNLLKDPDFKKIFVNND